MPAHPLLPVVALAGAALSVAGAGLLAVQDVRDEQRRERALAVEQQAERDLTAYRERLQVLATGVYDTVQPLQLAFGDLDRGDVSAIDVLIDVGLHVSSPTGLTPLEQRLVAVEPPAPLRDQHAAVRAAVQELRTAAAVLTPLKESDDEATYADTIADSDIALDRATANWRRALEPVFANRFPHLPVVQGSPGSRVPLSHAAYLRDAGNICSAGLDVAADVLDEGEPGLDELAGLVDDLAGRIPALLAVRAPTADDTLVSSSIRAHLTRTTDLQQGFQRLQAAARRGDPAAAREASVQVGRGEIAAEKAAAGYTAYGSDVCSLYLVGLDEDSSTTPPATQT